MPNLCQPSGWHEHPMGDSRGCERQQVSTLEPRAQSEHADSIKDSI